MSTRKDIAALKVRTRRALNEVRAAVGLPPKPLIPRVVERLSKEDPRVLKLKQRMAAPQNERSEKR